MNPLQEHPNIFCNDQFKIKNEDGNSIVGYDFETGMFLSIPKRQPQGAEFYDYNKPENCTLIARKIDDMTEDEKATWKSFIHVDYPGMIPVYAEQTAYLLEIGVYPFNQDHFKDGTVININEI